MSTGEQEKFRHVRYGKAASRLRRAEPTVGAPAGRPEPVAPGRTVRTASSLRLKKGVLDGGSAAPKGHEQRCSMTCPRRRGCSQTAATTQFGTGMPFHTLHSGTEISDHAYQIRHASLPKPQPHRDHVDRLKDWCRVATRYDRSLTVFFAALALITVIFCL